MMQDWEQYKFLTVTEVSNLLRVSKMTVYRLVSIGDLAAIRVGRSLRIPEKVVREYLAPSLGTSGGVKLTDELVERLAQQAEQGHEVAG